MQGTDTLSPRQFGAPGSFDADYNRALGAIDQRKNSERAAKRLASGKGPKKVKYAKYNPPKITV